VRTVAFLKLLGVPFLVPSGGAWRGTAGIVYVAAIILIGGAFPSKGLTDPVLQPLLHGDRERPWRGTTNASCTRSAIPDGVGA